ncbi:hypothetical protein A2963_04450 [Candidatus Roizmanbacteria bacterium RIFCSPLOWO2_01_FULL_40_13]|nr:MAG: hypothetical protein A2963_04450 [Candidatus Roizmanbacteria bacterium RIFCSPLOWO2_01_FULL_40_13]
MYSLIILSCFLFLPKEVFGEILFQDNFDDGNSNGWIVARNMQWGNQSNPCYKDGSPTDWEIKDGRFGIYIAGPGCVTEVSPTDGVWNSSWNNYIFETDVEFVRGTDHNLAFRYTGSPNFDWYGFHFIVSPNPANSSIVLQRVLNTNLYSDSVNYALSKNVIYHLKVVVNGEHIQLFINDNQVFDYPDAGARFPTGRIALQASVGGDPESETYFDNVVVRSVDELEPPEPEGKTPIVLLPGLGASWNTEAMLTGEPSIDWKLTPFVKVYDNFKNTFVENGGYIEGQDYFEFYYDWRKPLDNLADQFKTYLETVVLAGKPENTKVNLVGHSLGGLLAKAYAQKYGLDKINKIVTAGSPHQGAVTAWQVWTGAEQGDKLSWGWLALELYLQLQKGKYASPVDAVHSLAPSVNNLMPTFDFAKKDGIAIPVNTMSNFNNYLNDLKNNLTVAVKNLLVTIAGHEDNPDKDTRRWVNLTNRSLADKLLGKWVDGKPESYESIPEGDLTVLELSALVDGAIDSTTVTSEHAGLLANQTGIQAVLDSLGLSEIEPSTEIVSPVRNPSLVFLLHSPAQIKVTTPAGGHAGYGVTTPISNSLYSEADKLLVIYGADEGNYQIEVVGTDTGDYQLEIGQLTEPKDFWTNLVGQTNGEIDQYQVNFEADNPEEQPLVDITGKTQISMAGLIFKQIRNQINQLNWDETTQQYRNPVINHLDKIDRSINADLIMVGAGNYSQAEKYTYLLILDAYDLRQKLDLMAEKINLADSVRADLKNQSHEAGQLLVDAYPGIFNQSGAKLTLRMVINHLAASQKINAARAENLAIIGDDVFAGNAYNLSLEMLDQAAEAINSSLPEAWMKSVVSRLLSLEATKLVD